MTSKRRRYLLVCLLLLACCILMPSGSPLLRADSAMLPLPANLTAVSPPVSMPAFSLSDPGGNPMRSVDLQGKVVVIRFWATW